MDSITEDHGYTPDHVSLSDYIGGQVLKREVSTDGGHTVSIYAEYAPDVRMVEYDYVAFAVALDHVGMRRFWSHEYKAEGLAHDAASAYLDGVVDTLNRLVAHNTGYSR